MPSIREGLSNALLESMYIGNVPIVSDLPGLEGYVIDHKENGFLVPKDNHQKFYEYLLDLYSQPELLRKISFNSIKKISNNFMMHNELNKIKLMYKSLID